MDFVNVVEILKSHLQKYGAPEFETHFTSDESNYEASIHQGDKFVLVRDGYYDSKPHNKKPPAITSFESLFTVGDATFLNYVSDYPLEEYPERLEEVFSIVDNFFANKYSITEERHQLLSKKKYLNIEEKGKMLHLVETRGDRK